MQKTGQLMDSTSYVDWVGILRELRLFAMQLPADRFYALYSLLAIVVIGYAARWFWRRFH